MSSGVVLIRLIRWRCGWWSLCDASESRGQTNMVDSTVVFS